MRSVTRFDGKSCYCFAFSLKSAVPSLVKASAACDELADMLDNWASDIESAIIEVTALTAEIENRRARPY